VWQPFAAEHVFAQTFTGKTADKSNLKLLQHQVLLVPTISVLMNVTSTRIPLIQSGRTAGTAAQVEELSQRERTFD
jgi:hypothetical protein